MSKNSSSLSFGGANFCGALTILFIGLKLAHVINWPWIWVLSPLWISFLIGITVIVIALVIWFLIEKS